MEGEEEEDLTVGALKLMRSLIGKCLVLLAACAHQDFAVMSRPKYIRTVMIRKLLLNYCRENKK